MNLPVVVGIIINSKNEILISQRALHKYAGGLWEFPGGKIEKDETPLSALKRELVEELDIHVVEASPWFCYQHQYEDLSVLLNVWKVIQFEGFAKSMEGQTIQWISLNQVAHFNFLSGNQFILDQLSPL